MHDSVLNNYIDGMKVIINSGSEDGTLAKCKKYSDYDFVKIIDQENRGVCGSKNRGIDEASGKYLMFIDVDDEFLAGASSKSVQKMENTQADALCYGYRQTTERNGQVSKVVAEYIPTTEYSCNTKDEVFARLFYGIFGIPVEAIQKWYSGEKIDWHKNFSAPWGHVYKREIIEKNKLRFQSDLLMYEDGIFNCQYYLECNSATYIDECLYLWKKRDTGITASKFERAKTDLKMSLLTERNKLRDRVIAEKGIDILPWYAGSNVLSILQMMQNYAGEVEENVAMRELMDYIDEPIVQESIKMYPIGGSLKKRVPALLIKKGQYKLLYKIICIAKKFGIVFSA